MQALVLCNGEPPPPALLQAWVARADLTIVTDGAMSWALAAKVRPDVLVGDMDSGAPVEGGPWEVHDAGAHETQENSDAEKAVLLALARGATAVTLLGATGRRLDHTLANLWLAARYCDQALILLADAYGECQVTRGRLTMPTRPGDIISILPLQPGTTVRTDGLRWPLQETLEPGSRGLSNEATGPVATIEVSGGPVAVVRVQEPDGGG